MCGYPNEEHSEQWIKKKKKELYLKSLLQKALGKKNSLIIVLMVYVVQPQNTVLTVDQNLRL